ncbi:serine/threonine protein kinase, partial [bacterium]|nr:serine/threonine protein kinase [bacterium]
MTRRSRHDIEAFLEAGAEPIIGPALAGEPADGLSGELIGPWRLLRPIGEGGMSIVYLAERADGEYAAQVAVKLLRHPGRDTSLARRFRMERQILADLTHPHIARIVDGGVGETGWPYLVMEHVDGEPFTTWALRRPRAERLRAFRDVCAAVHHAHRHLVVHRDLKPSNILVGPDGAVKLLDFGIAKLLDADAADTGFTVPFTGTGLRLMTPEYAAPEQVRGEPITTGTDVYALGVLLYEILAGRRPYELAQAAPAEIEDRVCRRDPPPPGSGDPDLDTICLKALRKEPAARYAGADELAADLARHAEGLPVTARPATVGYRVGKFVRRNRAAVAGGLVVAMLATAFAISSVRQAAATARARDKAEDEALRATAVTGFLLDLFRAGDPRQAGTDTLQVADLLARGLDQADALAGQPAVQAEMRLVVGRAYSRLGRYPEGEAALRAGLAGPVAAAQGLTGQVELAENLLAQGRVEEAEAMAREAAARQEARGGPEDPATARAVGVWGATLAASGREAAAESLLVMAVGNLTRDGRPVDREALVIMNNLADIRIKLGKDAEARDLLAEILPRQREILGSDHYDVASTLNNLAVANRRLGDPAAAESLYVASLAIKRKRLGDDHPDVARTLDNLGIALGMQAKYDAAEENFMAALRIRERTLGENHPSVARNWNNLAVLMMRKGDDARSAAYSARAVAVGRAAETAPADMVGNLTNLAISSASLGRLDEAGAAADEAWRLAQSGTPPGHPVRAMALAGLAEVHLRAGRLAEADSAQTRVVALFAQRYGDHHPAVATAAVRTARLRLAQGRL